MLIYKRMNVFPNANRDAISEVDSSSARIRVVVPDSEIVQFDRPLPMTVARKPNADRPDVGSADAAAETVRRSLHCRIDPTVVEWSETELSR